MTSFAKTSRPRPPRITAALADLPCTPPSRLLSDSLTPSHAISSHQARSTSRLFLLFGCVSSLALVSLSRSASLSRLLHLLVYEGLVSVVRLSFGRAAACSSFSAEDDSDLSADVCDGFLRSDDCFAFSVLTFDGLRRTGFSDASFI